LGNDQIRKIAEHFDRDRAVISQDLKKVELRLREDKNSKGAMAVLGQLIKDEKRKIELNELCLTSILLAHLRLVSRPGTLQRTGLNLEEVL
jgi:hypothetical protein